MRLYFSGLVVLSGIGYRLNEKHLWSESQRQKIFANGEMELKRKAERVVFLSQQPYKAKERYLNFCYACGGGK